MTHKPENKEDANPNLPQGDLTNPVVYTHYLHQDILERLEMQAIMCNARPDARPAINILEALAMLGEINRLNTRLTIAEARLGRVARNHPEAYFAALENAERP